MSTVKIMDRLPHQQRLVDVLWTPGSKQRAFCAEASDLTANRESRPRNQCPHCDHYFQSKHLLQKIIQGQGEDAELAGWIFGCPNCSAELTVFND